MDLSSVFNSTPTRLRWNSPKLVVWRIIRFSWAVRFSRVLSPSKTNGGFTWRWPQNENFVVVSNIRYFHPYQGKWSNLTYIFQRGWNHQPEKDNNLPSAFIFWGSSRYFSGMLVFFLFKCLPLKLRKMKDLLDIFCVCVFETPTVVIIISHRIYVWYIYLHLVDLYGKCRQIYSTIHGSYYEYGVKRSKNHGRILRIPWRFQQRSATTKIWLNFRMDGRLHICIFTANSKDSYLNESPVGSSLTYLSIYLLIYALHI